MLSGRTATKKEKEMKTKGIDGILIETYNWGKTAAFWRDLGYVVEFETDHNSGRLRHPDGGPYLFIAERPQDHSLQVTLGIAVEDASHFTPPHSGAVVQPFQEQHWPALQMLLADPDGRHVAVEAPLPAATS
jgi:hypothetical protein